MKKIIVLISLFSLLGLALLLWPPYLQAMGVGILVSSFVNAVLFYKTWHRRTLDAAVFLRRLLRAEWLKWLSLMLALALIYRYTHLHWGYVILGLILMQAFYWFATVLLVKSPVNAAKGGIQ